MKFQRLTAGRDACYYAERRGASCSLEGWRQSRLEAEQLDSDTYSVRWRNRSRVNSTLDLALSNKPLIKGLSLQGESGVIFQSVFLVFSPKGPVAAFLTIFDKL